MADLIEICKSNLSTLKERIAFNQKKFKHGPSAVVDWASPKPFELAAATARSCYKNKPVYPNDFDNPESGEKREGPYGCDKLVPSLYHSGHKTPLGHPTSHLVITASRLSIWSFLHSYMFYSSSNQQSQRYAEMFKGVREDALADQSTIPQIVDLDYAILPNFTNSSSEEIYKKAFTMQFRAYRKITDLINETAGKDFYERFPKLKGEKEGARNLRRRCLEISRYVLPLGTMAHLWYSLSLLSAYRLDRYPDANAPSESQLIADSILKSWAEKSPENIRILAENPVTIPYESTIEGKFSAEIPNPIANRRFVKDFDSKLNGLNSKLINYSLEGEELIAQAVRSVVGKSKADLPNAEAIELALNPAKNPALIHPLDDKLRSPVSLGLYHANYTFAKRISHTCDSQNQRHRTIPGGRPILANQYTGDAKDCIIPDLIANNPEALRVFTGTMEKSFRAIENLIEDGESWENVQYLLPNAIPVRFIETAPLLFLHSKLRERLCWNAQKEIWDVSKEELKQIKTVHPNIAKWIGAPCNIVDLGKKRGTGWNKNPIKYWLMPRIPR